MTPLKLFVCMATPLSRVRRNGKSSLCVPTPDVEEVVIHTDRMSRSHRSVRFDGCRKRRLITVLTVRNVDENLKPGRWVVPVNCLLQKNGGCLRWKPRKLRSKWHTYTKVSPSRYPAINRSNFDKFLPFGWESDISFRIEDRAWPFCDICRVGTWCLLRFCVFSNTVRKKIEIFCWSAEK